MTDPAVDMGLIGHLKDLRRVVGRSLLAICLGFILAFCYSEMVFDFIRAPIAPFLNTGGLKFTGVTDLFVSHIKVSILAGIIMTCPFWLFQIWTFVAPGLYKEEKTWSVVFIFAGTVLFLTGVAFVYYVVYPMAFDFLLNYGDGTDEALITLGEYIGFFVMTTLVFGLAFEVPLILVMLGALGVITHEMLRSKRRYAIITMAILAAVVTPPDVVSQIAMLVPLVFLYESAVWIVYLIEKSRKQITE